MTAICWQVFARAPRPGNTKTRLIPALGAEGAARLYVELLSHVLATLGQVRHDADISELWADHETSLEGLAGEAQAWHMHLRLQHSGDLGSRMMLALAAGVSSTRSCVLIGSDLAGLVPAHLHQARNALAAGADWVLAPALDGGFGLIGTRHPPARTLLAAIPWGGPDVMTLTRERLRHAGCIWEELPALWDVDEPADLARLAGLPKLAHWAREAP